MAKKAKSPKTVTTAAKRRARRTPPRRAGVHRSLSPRRRVGAATEDPTGALAAGSVPDDDRPDMDGQIASGGGSLVVGIGMSAGGLESCSQLLEMLPSKPGFAIIVVQHLSPHTPSALPALLGARSTMRVTEAATGTSILPNQVYVIPPDYMLEMAEDKLRLVPRSADHPTPINHFFISLAQAYGDRSVAVVLSGTGSDGAEGVRAVKLRGGTVIVQDPATAKYDGMPRAAIANGSADMVLAPPDIARKLVDVLAHAPRDGFDQPIEADELATICEMLRITSGVDFAHYKAPTLRRRILRRMMITRTGDVGSYIAKLQANSDEVHNLYQDILIHVTRFFREPESFQALMNAVLPKMLADRKSDNPVRLWVAGCATGEEVYSLAMTVFDVLGDDAGSVSVQIFGTDVSEAAVDFARQGQYPANIAEDVQPDKLRRYFVRTDGSYRVSKAIRDRCVFARQDLTRDPPFSKLDLVLCRNVLIYLDASLQRKVIRIFHYALKNNGYLVLGHAETIGADAELFALVDKKHRIYRKKPADTLALMAPSLGAYAPSSRVVPSVAGTVDVGRDVRAAQNEANRTLLDRYGPPAVVVNESLDIVQFRGHTGPYLEPAPGDASLNLLKLAREGLLHGLRSALQAARKSRKPVRREGLRVRSDGTWTDLDLEVVPLTAVPNVHYLVVFDDSKRGDREPAAKARAGGPQRKERKDGVRAERLESELAATREYLQSIIQEVEAANQELQSANEEILSSNEELQSTNEELDTAKEELQSTNEELNTLNEELHGRNEELTRVNSDLVNLLASVHIAIVIVSTDLRIRRFTPMAETLLNLIPGDLGRPITQLRPNLDVANIGELVLAVIDKVEPIERDVRDSEGRWFSLRIRPYKGLENRIEGAVVAIFDVDNVRRHEAEVARLRAYADGVMDTVAQPLVVLDRSLRVLRVNASFLDVFGLAKADVEGRFIYDVRNGEWNTSGLKDLLDGVREGAGKSKLDRATVAVAARNLLLTARSLQGVGGEQQIVLAFEETSGKEV